MKEENKILSLLNKWEKKEAYYNLFDVHYFMLNEAFQEHIPFHIINKKYTQQKDNQLFEFGTYETGGSFCIWNYKGLVEKKPVVYLSDSGSFSIIAPSLHDFVCFLTNGKLICAGDSDENENDIHRHWETFDDFNEQLEDLADENDISTEEAKQELQKSLTDFKTFFDNTLTCKTKL